MNRAILAAVATAMATSAFAGTFASDVFNATDATEDDPKNGWSYVYAYAITPPSSRTLVPASGKDGSQSVRLTADFSGVPMAPWGSTYFGAGFGSYLTVDAQPMTTIISEYSASFDAKMVGSYQNTGMTNVRIELQFLCNDDTNPDGTPVAVPDANDGSEFMGGFKTAAISVFAENAWETRTIGFDQFIPQDLDGDGPGTAVASWATIQTALAAGNLHGANLAITVDDGANEAGKWGIDAGNELWADNFQVSVVPEPSSLGAIAAAGLLLARRRK